MEITSHPRLNWCPACGTLLEVATGVGHANPPTPGAFSVCFECKTLTRYDEGLNLVRATADDVENSLTLEQVEMIRKLGAHW